MKASVIICTKNRKEELNKCLESIKRQTRLPNEVIIIDDGDLDFFYVENLLLNKFINYMQEEGYTSFKRYPGIMIKCLN